MKKWTLTREDLGRRVLLGGNWVTTDHWCLHIVHFSPAMRLKLGLGPSGWDLKTTAVTAPLAAIGTAEEAMAPFDDLRPDQMYWDSMWRLQKGPVTGHLYSNATKTGHVWLRDRVAKWVGHEVWGRQDEPWVVNHNKNVSAAFATLDWGDER